jgi:hypothetical protein
MEGMAGDEVEADFALDGGPATTDSRKEKV